jgi:hypothetical protein
MRALSQESVGRVSAVELADGDEVQRREEEAEPGGESDGAYVEVVALGEVRPDRGREPLEEEGLAEADAGLGGKGRPGSRCRDTDDERGEDHEETGERSSETDIDQGLPVREARLDDDERAKSADEGERKRNKEGKRGVDPIVSGGPVVAHLVGQDDGE